MSSFDPPHAPDEDPNPYRAPSAEFAPSAVEFGDDLDEAEATRRRYLSHEASVKSIGSLCLLGAFFGLIGSATMFLIAAGVVPSPPRGPNDQAAELVPYVFAGVGVFYLLSTMVNAALGIGLHKLQTWARWTVVILTSLSLVYILIVGVALMIVTNPAVGGMVVLLAGGISGYIIYLLVCPKASVVFSHEYKLIVAKTPHVRYKTGLLVKILLGFIIALIVVSILAPILSRR